MVFVHVTGKSKFTDTDQFDDFYVFLDTFSIKTILTIIWYSDWCPE